MNKCKNCSVDIPNTKKFCNKSCSATYNNKLYPKRTGGREKPKCLNCNTELALYNKKYCNNKCQMDYEYKTHSIPLIERGEKTNTTTVKKYLKETRGNNCSECGIGDLWNGKPITLQLDHMDGNSDNNNLNNLRLLCPNCHSQTETYGSKGVGARYRKNNKRNLYLRKYKGY
jgi:predicted nucleic acid-binding Zn ribbon protein